MRKINATAVFYVLSAELTGILSALLAGNIRETYQMLQKPPLSPPGFLFGIVWLILYALMGYSAYLVEQSGPAARRALKLYWLQLGLNFLWSILFFRFGWYWAAALEIMVLLFFIALTAKEFIKINTPAGKLMLPYFLWVVFAAYLNIGFALLN